MTKPREYDDTTNSVTLRDENNRATTLTYRAFGHPDDARLISVVDANQQTWSYTYDAIGNLTQIVTPTGHTRTWLRNTSGLVTSETHPESGTVLYTSYDNAGVLKRKVDAKGTEFVFYHDDNDRVWRFYAGTNRTDIVYEPGSDNRVSVNKIGSVSTTFDYDTAGRLAHRRDVIGGFAFDSEYEYNGNDQVTAITYPSGRVVQYERNDPEGRITRAFETARSYASSLTYHPSGAVESYSAGNILTTLTHNPARYWVESINAGSLLQLNYGNYDGVGNVGTITDSRGPAWGQAFTYDPLHRLETAAGPWGPTDYAYDAHGNRQTTASSTYVYDPATLRLTAQNGQPFGYDNNGNLTSRPGATFTYTPENWLASVNGTEATYLYDYDGWRARKTVTGDTTFYLRGPSGELLTEYHQLGASARVRDYVYAESRLLSAVDKSVSFPGCGSGSVPDGSPHSMTIASGGTGSFTFEGTACRRVSVVITTGTLTPNCLGTIYLYKPGGMEVAHTGGACAGTMLEPVVLPVSGTYTVVVDPLNDNAGTISVSAYDVVDVTGSMTLGQPQNAAITTPGQRGVWTFTGTTNQRVSVVIAAAAMTNCLGTLTIYKPDGTQLAQDGGAGCAGMMIDPIVVLPTNGTYTVIVDPLKLSMGQIAVAAYDIVDLTGSITVNGSAMPGPLTTPGQRGLWTFDGTSGQQVRGIVDATTVSSCSYGGHKFKILKPDGTDLISKNGICAASTVGPVILPSTGTYTLVVDPATSYTGLVTVRVVSP